MFKLKYGYIVAGIATGLVLFAIFLWSLPDGKLHIRFCDVGQGDAAYVRFPDGRDMLVDGGPNDKVLECLGRAMPFWDRHINLVVMTHPQKDHMQGLITVLDRFDTDYFVRSDVDHTSVGYQKLMKVVKKRNFSVEFITAGEKISIGSAVLTLLWPSGEQIASTKYSDVLAATTEKNLNDYSLVFLLTYGSFETLFTGDADSRVDALYEYRLIANKDIEVLKFPHHGSKTGASNTFLDIVSPQLAVISTGKNSYGHPTKEALETLRQKVIQTLRTDEEGDIEIVSDGRNWTVNTQKKNNSAK